ncbi:MAG: aspartate dehydrogenase domain-containing protein [Acetivibrionales bacterium]|jgi:aspartate dehydrogenase
MKAIGIIGYGLIGRYIHEHLNEIENVNLSFVYDLSKEATTGLPKEIVLDSPEKLEKHFKYNKVDLVVETATYQAVQQLAPVILPCSDMLVFSASAFADEGFADEAEQLCKKWQNKIYIPHGAILGLDGIFDGREILESVRITTTKKPANLGSNVTEKTVLFEGTTREACKKFPRNVNVHAGIALAGLGFDKTCSRIVADPDAEGNTHLIEVLGDGMRFCIEVCSVPKGLVTGAYTPVAAFSTVKRIISNHAGLTVI